MWDGRFTWANLEKKRLVYSNVRIDLRMPKLYATPKDAMGYVFNPSISPR